MLVTPEKILSSYLSKLSLKVSKKLIDQQLRSHPHYPSLLSITDTLDYLGIKNSAAEGDRNHLQELKTPFLAHLKSNGGEFVIVENVDTIEIAHPNFFSKWSGVVLNIEKPIKWHHKENEALLKQEKKSKAEEAWVLGLLVSVTVAAVALCDNWLFTSLISISVAGFFVSSLAALQELGIENEMVDRVCGKNEDCNAVIKAKTFRFSFEIGLSDLNIIWFFSLWLTLILSTLTGATNGVIGVLSFPALLALPVTVYSIYYQERVAKRWCRLCLITIVLLWLQFLVLWPSLTSSSWGTSIDVKSVLFTATVLLITGIVWLSIKHLIQQNKKMEAQAWAAARFKGNEAVFSALLEKQRKVVVVPWENDLQIGNASAPLQITVACNPYCNPCAIAHEKLNNLLERYKDQIGLTVRFSVKASDYENKHSKAVAHILAHLKETQVHKSRSLKAAYTKEILHDWFQVMNLKEFATRYPVTTKVEELETLTMNEAWVNESKITFTPTVFINGYVLPQFYNVNDLDRVVGGLLGSLDLDETAIEHSMAVA